LIFVRINQRPDAFIGKHLSQEPFFYATVDDVYARDAFSGRADALLESGNLRWRQIGAMSFEQLLGFLDRKLPYQLSVALDAGERRQVDQFGCPQATGYLDGHSI